MDYGERWVIERATPPHEHLHCIVTQGGTVGRYFCAYTGDKESRAVRCVNALQGIPDYVVESAWFRQLIIQLSTNNYQSAIEQAKRNIRKEIDVTEMLLEATDKHDARNKLKGRLAGLRHALRNIRHNPVDVHV